LWEELELGRQTEHTYTMQLLFLIGLVGFAAARPQFQAVQEIVSRATGEVILVGADGLDINGCLVGPSGEKVCPLGAFGSDGKSRVNFRGNQGPGQTGGNGNAVPVNAAGQAYDPAAETYKKQIEQYQKWALQQVENAKRQLGTA